MPKVRLRHLLPLLALSFAHAGHASSARTETLRLAIGSPAQIVRDEDGVSHIFANTEADVAYLQGYVHARDRLFQMDTLRHQAAGTLAELAGPKSLPDDVQLRTFGIRRAAERSLPLLSAPTRAALKSYAAGVNAYVSKSPLPPEYATIEIAKFEPWTEIDSISVLKLIAFQLAFDINDLQQTLILQSYQTAGAQRGFDGAALFAEDLVRVAPFEKAAIIPDAVQAPVRPTRVGHASPLDASHLNSTTLQMARKVLDDVQRAPFAADAVKSPDDERGSNSFLVSGRFSVSGEPLIAGDQHLTLSAPAPWYDIELHTKSGGIDAIGASFPGVPFIILGSNDRIVWNATNHQLDVTDIYQERIVADPSSPSGLSTMYLGAMEHVIPLPQVFRANQLRDGKLDNLATVPSSDEIPPAVLIVPRRNQGPILRLNVGAGTALSLQFAGSSGTRELDAFRGFTRARNIGDFRRAMQFFDVGSQNFMYADVEGNIAHFVSGEAPLREDLQAGKVAGLPPLFIRNGQGGNEWIEAKTNDPRRSLPYEILPESEMPRVVNPPRGFIVSANNDPLGVLQDNDALNQTRPGGGIFYLGATYTESIRAKRADQIIEEKIRRRGRLTTQDLKDVQADTVMLDARFFTPKILAAFDNARKPDAHPALVQLAADPRVVEAVGRLASWDQSTPTGIRLGYDADDNSGARREPSANEVAHSISATIYSVWRNQFLNSTIGATLKSLGLTAFNTGNRRELITAARTLFDRFDERQGFGVSGVNFFDVPGINDAATRRDVIVLRSLTMALDKLAGNDYADAFRRSTNQSDYRWGLLHRVILEHPLNREFPEFSIPTANGAFPAPLGPTLPGIPVDGGFLTVDVSNNNVLDDTAAGFLFRFGATRRYVGRARSFGEGFDVETSLPGGQSGVPGSPFHLNLLEEWLSNDTHPLRQGSIELLRDIATIDVVLPDRK